MTGAGASVKHLYRRHYALSLAVETLLCRRKQPRRGCITHVSRPGYPRTRRQCRGGQPTPDPHSRKRCFNDATSTTKLKNPAKGRGYCARRKCTQMNGRDGRTWISSSTRRGSSVDTASHDVSARTCRLPLGQAILAIRGKHLHPKRKQPKHSYKTS